MLNDKINELATHIKNDNTRDLCRRINDFKKGYQSIINLAKNENGDVLADSRNILNTWKNYFFQILNVHSVSRVTQIQ
jgi:hypothetical protein